MGKTSTLCIVLPLYDVGVNLSVIPQPQPLLTISDLAKRTGVPPATLRSWENRYGLPRPQRLAGGHRRYTEQDVSLVEEVLRQRDSGLALKVAMERADSRIVEADTSVFAGLRRRHPTLAPQLLRKRTVLGLTRAIEDESCARAAHPVIFVSFQRERFYRASRPRWAELARTARAVVVFADFAAASRRRPGSPMTVPVPADAPMLREWALVCDAPDHPACLAGWELPGQVGSPDGERRFETLWSVEPRVVRDAAQIGARLAQQFAPRTATRLAGLLEGDPPSASADLRRSAGLLNRMVDYVDGGRA